MEQIFLQMSALQPLSCWDIFLLKHVPEQLELFCPGRFLDNTQKPIKCHSFTQRNS